MPETLVSGVSVQERRRKLANFANSLIAAENASEPVEKPLVTPPLAALAEGFRSEVPIVVSEGAKGTGKTLIARFLVAQERWDKAVEALGRGDTAVPALLLPVCGSIQSSNAVQQQFNGKREVIAKALGLPAPMPMHETTLWLKKQIQVPSNEQAWAALWLDLIAWSAGFEPKTEGAGDRFLDFLRQNKRQVVAIMEGLEELYDSSSSEGVPEMMRALLVSLPQRLRYESSRPLGLIVFPRRDTVDAAILQNIDQYRREYSQYTLSWTEDDVLELAAWLATKAGALPDLWTETFKSNSRTDKAFALDRLWGRKLGRDDVGDRRVREAYTATWIVAVLSDLQGRLVPRDLVRLLAYAAGSSTPTEEDNFYAGRLLNPGPLRNAVEPTSLAKVRDTEEEIVELKPIFKKFRDASESVFAPISEEALQALDLHSKDVDVLRRHGIVFGDTAPYEVPELFRRGLGLRHSGARYSVVNLYRRARQRLGMAR